MIAALTAAAGRRGEDQPHRVGLAADAQGMDLAGRLFRGQRRADLQHVGPQHHGPGRIEVIGVVLHERRAARQAARP